MDWEVGATVDDRTEESRGSAGFFAPRIGVIIRQI